MASDIWMPLYIGDYLADTMHLSTLEHGAYLLLLFSYWKNKGPIPDDDHCLSSIAKVSLSDWSAIRSKVARFFKIDGGMWIHKRVEVELKRAISAQVAKRQGAMKTNEKRWSSHSVSLSDTPSVSISTVQSQSVQREISTGGRSPLTRKEFNTLAEMRAIPPECAEWVWNEAEACGWVDKHNRPIVNVESHLIKVHISWRTNLHKAKTGNGSLPLWRQIESLQDDIDRHVANSESAYHQINCTDLEKADLRAKRIKLRELKATK